MPKYVRMGTGRYMINVIDKNLSYGLKVLENEGYKIFVSDTLFTSAFDPGLLLISILNQILELKRGVQ